MGKMKKTDNKQGPKRAPGNISWRQRKRDSKKFRERKLLKEILVEKKEEVAEKVEKADKQNDDGLQQKVEDDMEEKGVSYTVSIAVPGSIMDNAQSPELRAYLAGQIARAAVIFEVDEIVVFDETAQMTAQQAETYSTTWGVSRGSDCNARMVKILQYMECPQYLRKSLFPLQEDLQYAGLLNPLDCLHHLRADDFSVMYREAVVLDKPTKQGKGSFCDAGLKREVQVDKQLKPHLRVTLELMNNDVSKKTLKGVVVSPNTPRRKCGHYWGYNVRLARSLNAAISESPYEDGYDLVIGTSDKGQSVDEFDLPEFRHTLIVFGGVKGLESCAENDESLRSVENLSDLFQFYLNTCPNQGSRTIRTEEALLITLSSLRPKIRAASGSV